VEFKTASIKGLILEKRRIQPSLPIKLNGRLER
jgi:hypothetical protein